MRPGLPRRLLLLAVAGGLAASVAAGCGGSSEETAPAPAEPTPGEPTPADMSGLSGSIEADGSSTVGPFAQAAAEAFGGEAKDVRITVGISGTGGGFERFCNGETDISNASRPIKEEEAAICAGKGIEYTEVRVATDALTVVVNPENDWATCLTVDQLKTIWAPEAEGQITNWNQVDPSFPDQNLVLAGPGTDSGTFDYFTDEVNGEEGASRADYTASEDDNVIVRAVEGEKGGLGYFGYTYFEENQEALRAVEIDSGNGCVAPSAAAAQDGTYTPLARPLFVYVKNEALARPEVAAFAGSMLENNTAIAEAALFVPLNPDQLAAEMAKLTPAG